MWIWCSRFCPPCLREDGAWRLAWQLGWTAVCVRHQVLLARPLPAMRHARHRSAPAAAGRTITKGR